MSNTRNSNLYLIAASVVVSVILLSLAVAPTISAPKAAVAPITSNSEITSDYYQRHPELNASAVRAVDVTGDFSLRHPDWIGNVQIVGIPVTGASEASDYFQRHSGLNVPAATSLDMADYFTRHPELRLPAQQIDLSDYFLRH